MTDAKLNRCVNPEQGFVKDSGTKTFAEGIVPLRVRTKVLSD